MISHDIFHFLCCVDVAERGVEFRIQHAMFPEFSGKWATAYVNTRLPLPTLQCAGYNLKLIYFTIFLINYVLNSSREVLWAYKNQVKLFALDLRQHVSHNTRGPNTTDGKTRALAFENNTIELRLSFLFLNITFLEEDVKHKCLGQLLQDYMKRNNSI